MLHVEHVITGMNLGKYLPISRWLHWSLHQMRNSTIRQSCFPRETQYFNEILIFVAVRFLKLFIFVSDLTDMQWKMENWQILNFSANTWPVMQDFPYTDMTWCIFIPVPVKIQEKKHTLIKRLYKLIYEIRLAVQFGFSIWNMAVKRTVMEELNWY
jgi:hypothetical protein